MKVVGIIQARMGSSRLPGKVLLTLGDRPVIQWVHERASRIPGVDYAVVATSTAVYDDALVQWCNRMSVPVFRGSEVDVLDRYVQCGRRHGADSVVRITADCPFIDPVESGRVVSAFMAQQPHYACNDRPSRLPDGLDTEIVSTEALEASWREANEVSDREHVTPFVRRNSGRFRSVSVTSDTDLSHHRWTLDELRDFDFLSAVADRLFRQGLSGSMHEILRIIEAEPHLRDLTSRVCPNDASRNVVG